MFWGNGDSNKLSLEERKTLEELRKLVETGHLVALTPDQTVIALNAIKFYTAVTATSGLFAGVRNVLVWFGGALAIYWAIKDGLAAYIKSVIGG